MTNAAILKGLKKLVEVHGSAKVAVALNYRDSRSITVWLTTKRIPKVRQELVKQLVEKGL